MSRQETKKATLPETKAWAECVEKYLAETTTKTVKSADGKTSAELAHETDPPAHGRWARKQRKPGSLPLLVKEAEIAKDAKVLKHDHYVSGEVDLAHMARVVVTEARRLNAKGIALHDPKHEDENTVLTVTNVL